MSCHDSWTPVPATFRAGIGSLPQPWEDIFGPLRRGAVDDLVLVAQCGQSIDARIATPTGHSHYINGEAGLAHLHRLRALVDAVVIGVGTAIADDPQLTVRRVAGPNPARVIIDPGGRLPPTARALAADGARRLLVTTDAALASQASGQRGHFTSARAGHSPKAGSSARGTRLSLPPDVEIVPLAAENGTLAPSAIVAALAARGFRRMLIEGGADTISRFVAARCLDRLHILVAPLILGAGHASLTLPPVARVDEAMRVPMRAHTLDGNSGDVLLDCDLSAQRAPIGWANKST
jgi:diaminohydroxyphosphoribosylaminopyrimidine deaminase / 5-amino-6-(5-phosphoribosylamino)uracil reductase